VRSGLAAAIVVALAATGCAHLDEVTLLPNEGDAATGAVAVLDPVTGKDLGLIDRANSRAKVSGRGLSVRDESVAALDTRYGELLSSLPERPRRFTLYFFEAKTELIPQSRAELPALFAEIARRPGADVQIIGHTDTMGSDESNDKLSLDRAREMATLLQGNGLDISIVRTSGRGERDNKVRLGNDARVPANRRVEIVVQ